MLARVDTSRVQNLQNLHTHQDDTILIIQQDVQNKQDVHTKHLALDTGATNTDEHIARRWPTSHWRALASVVHPDTIAAELLTHRAS